MSHKTKEVGFLYSSKRKYGYKWLTQKYPIKS